MTGAGAGPGIIAGGRTIDRGGRGGGGTAGTIGTMIGVTADAMAATIAIGAIAATAAGAEKRWSAMGPRHPAETAGCLSTLVAFCRELH